MNRLLLFIILTVALSACRTSGSADDIRSMIRQEYLKAEPSQSAEALALTMDSVGRWPDIDYSDRSPALWQLEHHLDRLIDIALVYEKTSHENLQLGSAVEKGLRQWFGGNYRNPNWWYTKIGVPRRFLALAYILDDDFPADLRDSVASVISVIDSDDFPARPGGDRIQVLSNHAKALLWKRDFSAAAKLFKKIENEASFAADEDKMYDAAGGEAVRNSYRPSGRGVQADMTFHHRGDRVNSTLTYGKELPEFFSEWALLLSDTDYRFSDESTHFVIDYYLDAMCRHLVKGRYAEPSVMNREIARPGEGAVDPHLAEKLLAISNGYRAEELRRYTSIQRGEAEHEATYFAPFRQSDYFAFSRPDFQTAVRLHSYRTANQEAPHNAEGIRNHFRGDGANMLSVTGREYSDIAPVFDFRMIPGATTPLLPYHPLEAWGNVQILDNPTEFAGAVSDGSYGAVGFAFISARSDLRARKSWYFFDDGYLCLGSAIECTGSDSIVTTIEQCLSPSGSMIISNTADKYYHSGNLYHILAGKAHADITHHTGCWNNCATGVEYACDSLSADVFTLAIEHGVRPKGATYAYSVVPHAELTTEENFGILCLNDSIHAAATDDGTLIYITFFSPGKVDTPAGEVGASAPCMVMIRDGRMLVSDPTQKEESLDISLSQGSQRVTLPRGKAAGTDVELKI